METKLNRKTKITEFKYGCDGGSLKIANEDGASFKLANHYGDGEFNLYLIEAVGWGPVHFKDAEDYKVYREFENSHPSEMLACIHVDDQESDWKVLFYDCDGYSGDGIVLSKDKYSIVFIHQDNDSNFYIYAYYR